ncbi:MULTISPECIES: methionyl-tRNA formyltransferase [unclassified Lentimicrobium]|uniref:methionyl-tRNA formyltransferase n=1 Tax=unclassified Lentimicrobium TaxID=2677434 RepID=UPI001555A012|nr:MULTISPECIES: methionyl-tRNA formyltransferase [unclassified Lentimicrobium]NPD48046.1 methionyl-tRNA formyltransferase [Lentimicrobium sp. S6]NPD86887.1 methionyl-tRNA formyltransferase [Lentimicrobium sp. L6]
MRMKDKLRIIFMGTPEFAVASLDALVQADCNIVGVVTIPDKLAGRGKKLQMSEVKRYALENKLPLLTPLKLKDPVFLEELRSLQADLQIVVAFRMLPEVVWAMPPQGTFNLHGSMLPQYRGAAPINHAIINGETETGVTTFFLDHEIDTGKVIEQRSCVINESDSAGDVHDRLMALGATLVVDTVKMIAEGGVLTKVQEELGKEQNIKHAPKIFKEDGLLHWNKNAATIYNKVRGLSPYPTAWTWLEGLAGGNRLSMKIYAVSKTEILSQFSPGSLSLENGKKLLVHTDDFCLEVSELQLQGKKRMKAADFLRGFSFDENMRFSV